VGDVHRTALQLSLAGPRPQRRFPGNARETDSADGHVLFSKASATELTGGGAGKMQRPLLELQELAAWNRLAIAFGIVPAEAPRDCPGEHEKRHETATAPRCDQNESPFRVRPGASSGPATP
jgi:hypothetical protein